MSIKSKLMVGYLILIVFSVSVLGFLVSYKSRDIVFNEVTEKSERVAKLIKNTVSVRNDLLSEKVSTDLKLAGKLIDNLGEIKVSNSKMVTVGEFSVPALYVGDEELTLDTKLVDDINKSTGAIVSIFSLKDKKLVRVSTTLIHGDKRAIGTFIDSSNSAAFNKIINGEEYYGSSIIEDDRYITAYKPVYDKNIGVVGAIAIGYKDINPYLEKIINDTKIGKTGYVYIMDSKGKAIVHPKYKGKDLSGYDFSKKIIKTKEAKEVNVIDYEFDGVSKMAVYKYFEPWDWYIVATANYDDLKSSSKTILNTTIITGMVIFIIASIIGLILANRFVKPINKLKDCMEIASKGDLSVQCDIETNNEIGVLAKSFNHMVKENKNLLEQAVQYDRLKTEFIANVSHEVKTPLNIIFSTVQLFSVYLANDKEELDINKFKKYIGTIKQNCYRLLRLVNNFIDITKIDSGFMELNLKNENIVEIVENITLSTAEYIESKSRTIIFDTDSEEKIMAFDAEKMERIILNLISNATKFTRAGDEITVNLYNRGDRVLIAVKDTGIGIPQDKFENIFERFKQVDPLLSRNHEGSGIGLSLVKSLVELHGGIISLKSKCGEGTEFLIDLPARLLDDDNDLKIVDEFKNQSNVEKIQIEFSDIYM